MCRKSSKDDDVIGLSKSLIKTWKKFVPESSEKKEKKKEKEREEKERVKEEQAKELGKSFPSR